MGGSSGGGGDTKMTGALPWWVEGPHKNLINKAENFAYGPRGQYIAYPDQRIAGLTDPEIAAQEARQSIYNQGDPAGEFASNQLGLAAGVIPEYRAASFAEFTPSEMERRMSPFIEGVIDPRLREARESFDQRLNQSNAASIARGGSVGSYRQGLERAMLESEKAKTLSDIRGAGMQSAYDQALSSFEADRQARMGGLSGQIGAYQNIAGAANQLGTSSLERDLTRVAELERSGAIPRELQQREMDLAYQDFLQERDFPAERMSFLSQILSGVPSQALASRTTSNPQPGLASQLASLGLGAAAIQQAFSGGGQ